MLALLLPMLGPVFDKIIGLIPDPAAAAKAKAEAMQMVLEAAARADQSQMEINKMQAQSGSIFVAGGRPFILWICGIGCAWNWVGLPVALFGFAAVGYPLDLKAADTTEMLPVLLGLLGMSGLRTYEKIQGVSRENLVKINSTTPGNSTNRIDQIPVSGQG